MKTTVNKLFFIGLIIVVLSSVANTSSAQDGFKNGDKLLNIGIGINSYYNGGIPVGASYEVGISDKVSVGANFDYLSNSYNNSKFTAMYLGVRAAYHFNEVLNIASNNIDVYGGAALGYRSFSWGNSSINGLGDNYGSGIYLGLFAGCKYYFSNSTGAFLELGAIGSTNARIGVAFKL